MSGSLASLPRGVVLGNPSAGNERYYCRPEYLLTAWTADDVPRTLRAMEHAQDRGLHLAGSLAYELGYVFEPSLRHLLKDGLSFPLIDFAAFSGPADPVELHAQFATGEILATRPAWGFAHYQVRFDRVHALVSAGDIYQVNLSFPVHVETRGSCFAIYQELCRRQPACHTAFVNLAGSAVVSISPEMFFRIDAGGMIEARPMKGTASRGFDENSDRKLREFLKGDEKTRAENLMIVDLLRNDLSRICKTGSVKVPHLFAIEEFPTLFQMVSTVQGLVPAGLALQDVFSALFPCGSITGAPKIRAMQVIDALEGVPRGPYCGAIGLIQPDGKMSFSVAIRTLVVGADGSATYNVGSGIVADSNCAAEYEECLLKAAILKNPKPASA